MPKGTWTPQTTQTPAVVHIEVTPRQETANPLIPFENDPFFRFFLDTPRVPKKFKREFKGVGTGMIMEAGGYILTNYHVVAGATDIRVSLSNGEQYTAKTVGADKKTDLAVIKISSGEPLPNVTFGDSDKVEVGEWVVAIGHLRALDQTVTQGIISAKHRQGVTDPSGYQDFLQTDVAINPGNSGGPLLNLEGKVIGVNAAIVSQSGGFEGIGFAVPSNMALHIAQALIFHGKVERGWLGVALQDLTPEIARSFGLETPRGALVGDVVQEGPSDKAGIQRGDVIISYQSREVPDASALRNEVANTTIGQEAEVTVWRRGEKRALTVQIGSLEGAAKMVPPSLKDHLGAEFRPVTPKEDAKYDLNSSEGVAVLWLDPTGPLGEVGFEVGDIILEVNGQTVVGMEGFVDTLSSFRPNHPITLLALDHRSGQTGYVQVQVR